MLSICGDILLTWEPFWLSLVGTNCLSSRTPRRLMGRKCEAALNQGLAKLLTWQIGNPNATSSGAVPATFLRSPKSRGGVVTVENDPRIRTDTVMHQLHAELLVRQFMFASRNPATTKLMSVRSNRK